jgi:hypothetical protein
MRRRSVLVAILLGFVLVIAFAAAAQEKKGGTQLSIVTASYRNGVLSVVVKNEGDDPGGGTLTVHREHMRCLEEDAEYCKQNPSEDCVAPCKKYETKDLGTETASIPTIPAGKEASIEVKVPDEEAYAEITAQPGSRLAYGVEIKPRA